MCKFGCLFLFVFKFFSFHLRDNWILVEAKVAHGYGLFILPLFVVQVDWLDLILEEVDFLLEVFLTI